MIIRFRYEVRGLHTHMRVFIGTSDVDMAMCGYLVMRNDEFELARSGGLAAEFVEEIL